MDINFFSEAMNAVGIKPIFLTDDDPSENDINNRCPGCGKANQWGELCPQCADRKTIARNQQPGTEAQREAELERQRKALES